MAAEGYLREVLADGARLFRYRESIRSLLGQPPTAGVAPFPPSPAPPARLSYPRPVWIGEIEVPDGLFTGAAPAPESGSASRANAAQETPTAGGAGHPSGSGQPGNRHDHVSEDGGTSESPSYGAPDQVFQAVVRSTAAESGATSQHDVDHRAAIERRLAATARPEPSAPARNHYEPEPFAALDPPVAHGPGGGNLAQELRIPGRTDRAAATPESTGRAFAPYRPTGGVNCRGEHSEPLPISGTAGGSMPAPRQTAAQAPARLPGEMPRLTGIVEQEASETSRPPSPPLIRRPAVSSSADTAQTGPTAEALPAQLATGGAGTLRWAELAAATATAAQPAKNDRAQRTRDAAPSAEPARTPLTPAAAPAPQFTVVRPSRLPETRPAFWERRHLGRLWSRALR